MSKLGTHPRDLVCLTCGKPLRRLWHSYTDYDARRKLSRPEVGKPASRGLFGGGKEVLETRKDPLEFWCGEHWNHGTVDAPFCRVKCVIQFAVACARAGMRLKPEKQGSET